MPTQEHVITTHHGAGHRARLRERFERSGLQGFSEHEILELLLTLCIPRCDVKMPAKMLLERFGSLRGALDAPLEALREIDGLGSVAPVALRIIREASTLYLQQFAEEARSLLNSTQRLIDFWTARLGDLPIEVFEVAYLDPEYRLLKNGVERIQEGDLSETIIYPRTILASALKRNAGGLVLAHNHPTGRAEPSPQDCELTKHLSQACASIGIHVVDHLIISRSGTFSFRRSGLLR
jgi:DNA repair protein RadC